MYWAKKILEWTSSPTLALQTAQYFNDKYALDGCDPNGFVGVGWSILGIHDQGWKERDVFGKIRFMNYAGCQRKFDVAAFVRQFPPAYETAMQVAKQHGKATANPKAKSETKERKRKAPSVS
jgi:deoxyribodipyrimidine photo-lyase